MIKNVVVNEHITVAENGIPTLQSDIDFTVEAFIKRISKFRINNIHWYQFSGTVNGKTVRMKAYKCWNQLLAIDGIKHGGLHDLNVKEWKAELTRALEYES